MNWSCLTAAASRSSGCARGGVLRLEVQDDAGSGVRRLGADRLHAEGVRHQEMMRGGERCFRFGPAGRVRADAISVVGDDVRLVERREVADAVTEPGGDERGELAERMAVARTGQPPASSRAWGRSQ